MKYFITGGAGFIGSHLTERLLDEGHTVSIIDNLSTGSIENIKHLKENQNFTYTIDDVMNESLMAELIDEADTVFHLAAAVGVKLIVESPVRTIETNIHGTQIVLDLANKKKKKVIVASTSEVYGKRDIIPFHEDDDILLGPTFKSRWSYACSKAIDEFLSLAYWKEKNLPVVVVRLFNTVGPRQTGRYGMVLPTFVRQALKNEPITVYGDGNQSRCFCAVTDIVDALAKLACEEKAVGDIFNLGATDEVTMMDLAKIIKEKTGSDSDIVTIPYEEAYEEGFEDMPRRKPSIDKANNLIGFQPTRNLEDIINSIIEYEKNRI